ncbi:alpha/beta hydrolase [Fragilaria crotonensis]|nr:alpha/beta hydrolase [Fragilaria crotonensis]
MVIAADMTAKLLMTTMTTALSSSIMKERTFVCSDGVKLAAQWYPPQLRSSAESSEPQIGAGTGDAISAANAAVPRHKILLLHGWLDNCRTFWKLAPHLPFDDVVALDLPGHGRSDHKSKDAPPIVLADAAFYVADVLQQLEWKSGVTIVGHSMGAAISLLYAATFPDQIQNSSFSKVLDR